VAGNLQGLDLTMDIRTVVSKEYFEKELAGIFRRAWLPIGHNYVFRGRATISYASCRGSTRHC
jgi:hypothetical protein